MGYPGSGSLISSSELGFSCGGGVLFVVWVRAGGILKLRDLL